MLPLVRINTNNPKLMTCWIALYELKIADNKSPLNKPANVCIKIKSIPWIAFTEGIRISNKNIVVVIIMKLWMETVQKLTIDWLMIISDFVIPEIKIFLHTVVSILSVMIKFTNYYISVPNTI